MKIRSNILIAGLIFSIVCFVGCKGKKQSSKPADKSAEPNVTQVVKVDSNINVVSSNMSVKPRNRQIIAMVNGVNIYKDDFNKRVDSQISPVQRQMQKNFREI